MSMFRDSPLGQLVRLVTSNKVLLYPEERPDFVLPWQAAAAEAEAALGDAEKPRVPEPAHSSSQDGQSPRESVESPDEQYADLEKQDTLDLEKQQTVQLSNTSTRHSSLGKTTSITRTKTRESTMAWTVDRMRTEEQEAIDRQQSRVIMPQTTAEGIILVDWYTTDDPENPQNYPLRKKVWISIVLWIYTFVVYCASAIYTPSEVGVMEHFNVGVPKAALGLSMFVLGYGTGPMLFSPLSEIPSIGRNIPYISSFTLFVVLAVPTALTPTFGGLLALRFLTGFFGSPCLATGGATVQDLYSFMSLPHGFSAWTAGAFAAPALGPLLSGFSVPAKGWRWSLWEILWMSAPALILMYVAFPETSASNILLRRAKRLRKLTGNENYKSQSELDQASMTPGKILVDALIKPMQITFLDPAVLFTNLYTAYIYGVYYSFFEVFPLVYIDIYGFSVGLMGVAFTNIVVACVIGMVIYYVYIEYYLTPDLLKRGPRAQEHRLVPAVFASICLPAGLFIFAWTSRADVHWIASIIGICLFATGSFVLFQCIFMYLPLSYPQYAASLFAANDLFRAFMAAGAIIYAHPLFVNLGIAAGVSLLAGLACLGVVGVWALWFFGARMRARSKFAQS